MFLMSWIQSLANRMVANRTRRRYGLPALNRYAQRRAAEVNTFLVGAPAERLEDKTLLAGVYTFDQAAFATAEGNATNTVNVVTITRDDTTAAESVDVVLVAGAGTEAADFTAGPITVNFGVGVAQVSVPIEFLGENVVEANETIDLSMNNFTGTGTTAGAANPTASLEITNDDTAVLSIDDVSLAEDGTFTFTITSSNPTETNITGTIDTADIVGEAAAGTDYGPSHKQCPIRLDVN